MDGAIWAENGPSGFGVRTQKADCQLSLKDPRPADCSRWIPHEIAPRPDRPTRRAHQCPLAKGPTSNSEVDDADNF